MRMIIKPTRETSLETTLHIRNFVLCIATYLNATCNIELQLQLEPE